MAGPTSGPAPSPLATPPGVALGTLGALAVACPEGEAVLTGARGGGHEGRLADLGGRRKGRRILGVGMQGACQLSWGAGLEARIGR